MIPKHPKMLQGIKPKVKTQYDRSFSEKYFEGAKDGFFNIHIEQPAIKTVLAELIVEGVTTALDVGCGFGRSTEMLHRLGARVIGIDSSSHMIDLGRREYPHLDLKQADAAKPLRLRKKSFDIITGSLIVHYAEDLMNLFANLSPYLKDGGRLVFSTGHPLFETMQPVLGSYFGGGGSPIRPYFPNRKADYWALSNAPEERMRYYRHNLEDISKALETTGFIIEKIRVPRPPDEKPEGVDAKLYEFARNYPTFIIVQAGKKGKKGRRLVS